MLPWTRRVLIGMTVLAATTAAPRLEACQERILSSRSRHR